jgi:hypothetical protein
MIFIMTILNPYEMTVDVVVNYKEQRTKGHVRVHIKRMQGDIVISVKLLCVYIVPGIKRK